MQVLSYKIRILDRQVPTIGNQTLARVEIHTNTGNAAGPKKLKINQINPNQCTH